MSSTPTAALERASPPLPSTTNNDPAGLSGPLKRLSLATASATALPPSSPVGPPLKSTQNHSIVSSATTDKPPQSPLRRTSSSSSISANQRSSSLTLNKKTSMGSLHGVGGVTPPRSPSFRRTSSNLLPTTVTAMPSKSPLSAAREEPPQPPPLTAASVAKAHFEKELEVHKQSGNPERQGQTVVILHDACYGHRYSRPRTSKASLSTIVERPERIHASILGVSTAYVRLGERHAEGKHAPHPKRDPRLFTHVPFRIHKTSRTMPLTSQAVTSVHGTKWMEELRVMCDAAETKLALNGKELIRPAGTGAVEDIDKPKLHEGDLYLCSESLSAFEGALGGVCDGVDAIFQHSSQGGPSRAFVCIRPPGHHCSGNFPSGFCWLNNVHVGIAHASMTYGLTHAAIIDFDLHHGDGSQAIAWAHNAKVASLPRNAANSKKSAIGYFSLHDINSYPCEMGDEEKVRNASLCLEDSHGQTIWNVHLQPWKSDVEFWDLYERRYSILLDKARAFLRAHTQRLLASLSHPVPKAAIFLSAGFDASEWESPGMQRHKVNVPTDFYARFTRDIVRLSEEEGLGVDGRIVSVLEGGYSDRALTSGVLSHLSGLADNSVTGLKEENAGANGLGYEMGRRMGVLSLDGHDTTEKIMSKDVFVKYKPTWWAPSRLEELEALVNPAPAPPAPRKPRTAVPATYTSPTQSFTAKIIAPPKDRRSFSGLASVDLSRSLSSTLSRAPSPPPPEVDWATASYELSRLLIPSDRQTRSCKPEELNAEASRVRRDRHSTIGIPAETGPAEGNRMQLRERKSKVPNYTLAEAEEERNIAISRSSRRKTVGGVSLAFDSASASGNGAQAEGFRRPTEQSRRRLSVASSIGSTNGDRTESMNGASLTRQVSNGTYTAGATRSGSSTRIRPESSMSNRPPIIPPLVKKSRVASGSSAVVPKGRKKEPPVPRVPSAYTKPPTNSEAVPAKLARTMKNEDHLSSELNEQLESQDVDGLADGMKKMSIKLNVPAKVEQEAREAKKVADRKKTTSRAPRKSIAPKATKSAVYTNTIPNESTLDLPRTEDEEPAVFDGPYVAATKIQDIVPNVTVESELQAHHAETPQFGAILEAPAISSLPSTLDHLEEQKTPHISTTEIIPSTDDILQPAPEPEPAQAIKQPLDFTLPNTNTTTSPQAQRMRQDLPIFTASSPIPFSNLNSVPSHTHSTMQQAPGGYLSAQSHPPDADPLRNAQGSSAPNAKGEDGKEEQEVDIWDIPETPRHG
ncbi:MAG: hypothetical protein M1830_002268 [Pleopsidium flavum]|nr:MAG: hypothetical protein M1830_002268 [Pleopsidium flavum]